MNIYDSYILVEKSQLNFNKFLKKYCSDNFEQRVGMDQYLEFSDKWIKFKNWKGLVAFGLTNSEDSFCIYLDSNTLDLAGCIVSFNKDKTMVLGVGLSSNDDVTKNIDFDVDKGLAVLSQLKRDFNAELGFIQLECPPPPDKKSFLSTMKSEMSFF